MKTRKTKVEFANSKPAAETVVFFANEITIGADGWAMITKFGDYPSDALIPDGKGGYKKEKAIQRVDRAGAEKMVAQFHNERKGIRKFLKGCNIYDGHPDVPGLGRFYPDKEPKGVFADLAVRDDGLYGLPVFTNEGSQLVETKQRRAFSGRIGDSEECEPVNGVPCYRPTTIYSAGLTNKPHLPVHFFNSDDTLADAPKTENQNTKNMKKKIMALITALALKPQFANAEEPTEGELDASLDLIQGKVATFANEKAGLESTIATRDGTITTLTTEKTTLTTERDTARTQFANERNARIADELTLALTSGRITAADKATWETRLKNEAQFANELNSLRALKPSVKTTSVTVKRGEREEQIDVNDKAAVRQFVNEAIEAVAVEKGYKLPKDYQKAFNEVQRRHGALFANMQTPEIKTPGRKS